MHVCILSQVRFFKEFFDSFNPLDCSPPGCSVHGIFQARILEWVYKCAKGSTLLPTLPTAHLFHVCPSDGYEWYLTGSEIFRVSVNLRIVYALFCVSVRVHCSGRKCQSFHQILKKVCDRIYFLKDFCLFNASEKNAYTKNWDMRKHWFSTNEIYKN